MKNNFEHVHTVGDLLKLIKDAYYLPSLTEEELHKIPVIFDTSDIKNQEALAIYYDKDDKVIRIWV